MVDGDLASLLSADASVRNANFRLISRALRALRAQSEARAAVIARALFTIDCSYSQLQSLGKYIQPPASAKPLKLAVLGGPTTTQLSSLIEGFLIAAGFAPDIYQCDFGLFRQELLLDDSGLARFQPDIIFLAVDESALARQPRPDSTHGDLADLVASETEDWQLLWKIAGDRWGALVIQNTFVSAREAAFGNLALTCPASARRFLAKLNDSLVDTSPDNVLIHDIGALVEEHGRRNWFDPRFSLIAKMPCSADCLVHYAASVAAQIKAVKGLSKKVLVLDLDHTLWGGIIGDDGIEGIRLGQGSGEGEAFLAFQQFALDLKNRGILLAICSKNDKSKALEPFEQCDDMILALDDISCFVANWQDKASNLRTIAATLNVGLDSMVFVDDNPAERALVRSLVPEVAVPEISADPAYYPQAVSRHRYFEMASFTLEDSQRADYYRANAQRSELQSSVGDIESFLKSLNMTARLSPIGLANIKRSAQLVNKSNQFNLTTRRYTEEELRRIASAADWTTLTISLKDRFGNNGLISVILLHQDGRDLIIDLWLMSCRVLLRGVEHLALERIVEVALARGCEWIVGQYIPTARNGMVADHYRNLGFIHHEAKDNTASTWRLSPLESLQVDQHFIERAVSE